jgi:hypothetical protein
MGGSLNAKSRMAWIRDQTGVLTRDLWKADQGWCRVHPLFRRERIGEGKLPWCCPLCLELAAAAQREKLMSEGGWRVEKRKAVGTDFKSVHGSGD